MKRSAVRRTVAAATLGLALLAVPSPASEFGAFLTTPTPRTDWKTGFGFHGAVISLPFLQAGGEFVRVGGEDPLTSIETYTAQVEVNPPSIKISPFVGLGVGAYRQKHGTTNDWGTLNAIFGGVRVPIGAASLRAELRKTSLSGSPRVNLDKRFSLGISFRF